MPALLRSRVRVHRARGALRSAVAASMARAWRAAAVLLAAELLLAGCTLPPAVTPEDPPLVEPDEKPPLEPGGLTPGQHQTLRDGGRIEELVELERQGQRYVGGVSYALVRAEPRQVFDVLNQLHTLSSVLPSTRSTRVIDRVGDTVRVELQQGNSVVSTTFTVFFQLEPPDGREEEHVVRFWLDPSQPHSIDDAWGFFRATRYDARHSLVSVGALVNLGPGLIRMLFEQRIQRSIMRMPKRIRETVERTYNAQGPAPGMRPRPSPARTPEGARSRGRVAGERRPPANLSGRPFW